MTEDEQEAESKKYSRGIWLVALASGNWGLFGPSRELLAIIPGETRLVELGPVAEEVGMEWELEASRRQRQPTVGAHAEQNVGDLGL